MDPFEIPRMYGDVLFGNSEPLNGRTTFAIRIVVKVVFTKDNLVERGRGTVRGCQDVSAINQGPSTGVDGPVGSFCVKKILFWKSLKG